MCRGLWCGFQRGTSVCRDKDPAPVPRLLPDELALRVHPGASAQMATRQTANSPNTPEAEGKARSHRMRGNSRSTEICSAARFRRKTRARARCKRAAARDVFLAET